MKRKYFLQFSAVLIIVVSLMVMASVMQEKEQQEYLFITTTAYSNGVDEEDGVDLVLYCYSINEHKMTRLMNVPTYAQYPAACVDIKEQKVYYSDGEPGDGYDNLYEYDMATKKINRLSDGKFLFNDIFIVDDTWIVNTARRFATVTQPAIFNQNTKQFAYYDSSDDDTWYFSLSYNYSTGQLLALTTSDKVMRTKKVATETHIRPKTIYTMDMNFQHRTPIYTTDEFEIRLTRQLDESHVLMSVDPFMGAAAPRTLKMLDITNQTVTDYDIPGIKEVSSFYPRDNTQGIYILGKQTTNEYRLYYYDIKSQTLVDIFEEYDLPTDYRGIVDFVYSIQ